jgi:hypothetical protein
MKYSPTSTFGCANLAFWLTCFLQTIKFGNKQCITTFHSNANLALYHIQLTIFLNHSFCPW